MALLPIGKITVDSDRVAKHYLPVRRDELMLLPPDVREWLPADHLVWFVLDVVTALDTSALHRRARLGGAGRAPYDPDMLLGVLVYAYAGGLRSSRKIERRCREDVGFMVLSGLSYPDHVTISRFRKDNTELMDELFDQVLVLCVKAGLGNLEHVAIDGTKITADASPVLTRDADGLRGTGRRWLAEAARVDEEEDERFGTARGDELPEELADPDQRKRVIADLLGQAAADPDRKRGQARQRKARKAEQALESADELHAEAEHRAEADLHQPIARIAKLEATLERVRGRVQARHDASAPRRTQAAAHGRRLSGRRPYRSTTTSTSASGHPARSCPATPGPQRQPPSRRPANEPHRPGRAVHAHPTNIFILGYNAQLAVSADHLIVACDVVQDPGDTNQLVRCSPPRRIGEHAGHRYRQPGPGRGHRALRRRIASEDNLAAPGPNRLVALGKRGHIAGDDPPTNPPSDDATHTHKMAWLLRTDEGKARYKKRAATVEPVNSHLKQARGLRRFARRGHRRRQSRARPRRPHHQPYALVHHRHRLNQRPPGHIARRHDRIDSETASLAPVDRTRSRDQP